MVSPDNGPTDRVSQMRLQFTDEIDAEESIIASDDGLVEWVREKFGDEVRTVGAYDDRTFELLYITAAVREQYTQQELIATGDEFVLSGRKEDPYHERLYHLGEFKYDVQGFDEGLVIRIPLGETRGLLVSFDSTATISLPQFVDQLTRRHDVVFQSATQG